MPILKLTDAERQALCQQLHRTHDARVYRRTLALLELARGRDVESLADLLRVDRRTIYHWQRAYAADHHPEALVDRPGRGRKSLWTPEQQRFLDALMARRPQTLNYPATGWTVGLLKDYLAREDLPECSETTLRRMVHHLQRTWKRLRHRLPPDPDYEKKKRDPSPAGASAAPQRGFV
jgi:transposase